MRGNSRVNPASIKSLKKISFFDAYESGVETHYDPETGYYGIDSQGRAVSEAEDLLSDEANRLDSIGAVYQRADRIITGNGEVTVTVTMSKDMEYPSMTDGKDIVFNGKIIENIDTDTIIGVNGLNYHELAHILYSPRQGSALGQYVKNNKMHRAFNILEEGRIESLLSAQYPTTTLTLEAMVSDYILKDSPSNWGDYFPTITGRTYIPIEVRQIIADKFIGQYGIDTAQELSSIIHDYRTLSFPTDFDIARGLIERMSKLVGLDEKEPPKWGSTGGHGDRDLPEKGRPKSGKEQSELQSKHTPTPTESLENKPTESLEKGIGTGGEGDIVDDITRELTDSERELAQLLNDRMKTIRLDKTIARDVKETRNAIVGNEDVTTRLAKAKVSDLKPRQEATIFARRFGQELERMVRDNDPAWERRLPSGKLNISRTMNPDINAIGEMFDVWDTGNDNTDIEASILIDNSGSMGSLMREVCEQAWIIKRGIESINGNVSVLSFNSECKIVYEKSERAKPNTIRHIQSGSFTNPYRALLESERSLKASSKPNKIFFAITDGQWDNDDKCNAVIKRMKDAGILTCVVFLTNGYDDYVKEITIKARQGDKDAIASLKTFAHGADVFRAVAKAKDTLTLATDIVKNTLRRSR